jgi:hypothetical protein
MIDYIKQHERYVSDCLDSNQEPEKLRELMAYHDKQISWIQHERLAHLITMLFVCLFFLLTFGFTMIHFIIPCILLTALLLVLTAAYILHYYRLENSVQGWYSLSNKIRMKLFQIK